MTKITIATPAFGEIFFGPYVRSLFRLTNALGRRKWQATFASISYADIVESRNYLLTHWYDKTDATHLLFLDADMGYPEQLIIDMIEFNKPIVGAIYPKRQIDLERIAQLSAAGNSSKRAIARAHDYIVRRERGTPTQRKNGFVSVDGCGTGIMLIARSAIDTMLAKMPGLSDAESAKGTPLAAGLDRMIRAFQPVRSGGRLLSEDFSFCHRWRQCKGEIWVNTAYEIEHVGLHRFKARYDDRGPQLTVSLPLGEKLAAVSRPKARVATGTIPMPGKAKRKLTVKVRE